MDQLPLLTTEKTPAPAPHFHGHRDRLKQKIIDAGESDSSFQDYELLELLLFTTIPRRDVKPLAKSLLSHFGDLWSVLSGNSMTLEKQFKLSSSTIALFRTSLTLSKRLTKQDLTQKPLIGSWQELLNYCTLTMGHEKIEQFRILFLDHKHRLIKDEIQNKGTINQTSVYPREVVKRALELSASSLILVHNHPTGDTKPSPQDIEITNQIIKAAGALNIKIHDHLIIGKSSHASFRSLGLL